MAYWSAIAFTGVRLAMTDANPNLFTAKAAGFAAMAVVLLGLDSSVRNRPRGATLTHSPRGGKAHAEQAAAMTRAGSHECRVRELRRDAPH
ncbi:hypothetical protein [Mycobacterium vicinigordonae]|uniref:Uncharacterized protein n=1 Tax=Mycobacterium vicinigordonae TaxID=1719132 RepID=A0A7D6DUZ2_9MYCO|nr:hypothetical protein [Mycobacterium vicinigordonae]QLL05327.1 hypothetical protein H0P51_15705 [Mycobacterium vicinigordonae]